MTCQPPTWIDSVLETGLPAYPKYNAPISGWHPTVFESSFIAQHPFWRGEVEVSWGEVASAIGLSVGRLNRGLLTRARALRAEYQDPDAVAQLNRFCELSALDVPIDGSFPPAWTLLVVEFFRMAGADQLWIRDEFGETLSACAPATQTLDLSLSRIHRRGAIFSPVPGVLASVDWDSFFTLFLGPRSLLLPLSKSLDGGPFWTAASFRARKRKPDARRVR